MAKKYLNRAWMTTATAGTGTVTLGSAFSNAYFTFAEAGIQDADTLTYVILDGTDVEIGTGTYTAAGTTLSRDTVTASRIAGVAGTTKLTLSGAASVFASNDADDTAFLDTALQTIRVNDATNNAITRPLTLSHTTSGSPSSGIGVGLAFEVETSADNNEVGAVIDAVPSDLTGGSEDFDFIVKLMVAGAAAATKVRFTSTGRLGLGSDVTPAVALDITGTGDTQVRAVDGASVDLRMNASSGSNVGFVGTYSNHDVIITANNNFAFRFGTDGTLKANSPTGGIGYGTGAGGTVTQATNRTTGVTLNKICGQITTNTASLAAEAAAEFTVTNSAVAATDVVVASIASGSNGGNTAVIVSGVAAGSFNLKVCNNNAALGTAETGAIVINYVVIKAVAA